MALNAPIQGSAADIIKVAMLNVDARARARPALRSRMLLQVHDELVFEVAPGEREALEALVREQMGGAAELDRAARRLGRHRPQLARRRPLSGCRASVSRREAASCGSSATGARDGRRLTGAAAPAHGVDDRARR